MGRFNLVVSLMTADNDFQREQAAAAESGARRAGVDVNVIFADNDPVNQSQQLLRIIQSKTSKPDGIAVFPLSGTGLVQVAKTAVASGMGWAVINRKVDYIRELRASANAPVFQVSTDHVEIGRIQGRQLRTLVPQGGDVLYIQGPAAAPASADRTLGLNETKPENIRLRSIRGAWTEESGYTAVSSWLRLSTSHGRSYVAVVAQNDVMAMGARKAFDKETSGAEREYWLNLPFVGCDGLPHTGQTWVRNGHLHATVIHPPTAGLAVEMLADALRTGKQPPEVTVIAPTSYPSTEGLLRKPIVSPQAFRFGAGVQLD